MNRVMIIHEKPKHLDNTNIYVEMLSFLTPVSFDFSFAENFINKNDFSNDFQAIVLSVGIPQEKHLNLCKLIRKKTENNWIPLLVITESTTLADKCSFFDADIDDYLNKPFDPIELILRLKSLIRRKERVLSSSTSLNRNNISPQSSYKYKDLIVNSKKVNFTPVEYDIFSFLYQNGDTLFSSENILTSVLGYSKRAGNPEIVRTHIKNIRNKVENDKNKPEIIINIPKKGYMLIKEKIEISNV